MTFGKPLLLLACAAALLAAGAAHAQLKSLDVGGFQLGQTVSEVEQTIQSRYPQFKTAKVYFPGPDGKASPRVALMMTGKPSPGSSVMNNGRHPDVFALAFSRVDGKLMHVTRYVDNKQGVVGEELRAALADKYGPEESTPPTRIEILQGANSAPAKLPMYQRTTKLGANADEFKCRAELPAAWARRAEQSAKPYCGPAVRAFWSDPIAPGVFQSYTITLYDHGRNWGDLEAARGAAKSAQDAATQRATGNASKPAL